MFRKIIFTLFLAFVTTNSFGEIIDVLKVNDNTELKVSIGDVSIESHIHFFIDADNNPNTGYSDVGIVGADYLIEDQDILRYPTDGSSNADWSWLDIPSTAVVTNQTTTYAEAQVGLSVFSNISSTIGIGIRLYDSTWNVVGSNYPTT